MKNEMAKILDINLSEKNNKNCQIFSISILKDILPLIAESGDNVFI